MRPAVFFKHLRCNEAVPLPPLLLRLLQIRRTLPFRRLLMVRHFLQLRRLLRLLHLLEMQQIRRLF